MTQDQANPGKWANVDAGPRQIKDLNRAISALRSEGQTVTELWGVAGGEEHSSNLQSLFGPVRPEVAELDEKIRANYGHQVTRANVRDIIAAYAAALPEARKSRRVEDKRRTPEEDAELRAQQAARDAKVAAEQAERDKVQNAVMAKMPRGAQAVIVAEYHEDASDIMTDYFASHTRRTVAIGWRFSKREDFRALRSAAAQYPETASLAADMTEHRDNHSMGAGNYLSDHGWAGSGTGWLIKSRTLPARYLHLTEDAIPDRPAVPEAAPASASNGAVTVSPSSLGKPGVIELRFDDKPGPEVREALKRGAGFRWTFNGGGCWYGYRDRYERARATRPELPELPAEDAEPKRAPELASA